MFGHNLTVNRFPHVFPVDMVAMSPDEEPHPGYAFMDYGADDWYSETEGKGPGIHESDEAGLDSYNNNYTPAVTAVLQDLIAQMQHSRLARQRQVHTYSSSQRDQAARPFEIWRVHAYDASRLDDLRNESSICFQLWHSRSDRVNDGRSGTRATLTGSDVCYWIRAIRARAASTSTKVCFLLSHEGAVCAHPMFLVVMSLVTVSPTSTVTPSQQKLISHTSLKERDTRPQGHKAAQRNESTKDGTREKERSGSGMLGRLFCLACKKVYSISDSSDMTLYSF